MTSAFTVPREPFLPDVVWVYTDDTGWLRPVDRLLDPVGWRAAVDTDDAIITQVDDGHPRGGDKGIWPTCSSSAPELMHRMLDVLKVEPGMRVLEIGTGTGYNAACLAESGAHVVSIEIDTALAEQARQALKATGYADWVTVITGDGEDGVPQHAPYDRVVVTAAVHTVPYAWVEQTRDGGRIVAPYTSRAVLGALLALDVSDGVAEGVAVGRAGFMPMRGQRLNQNDVPPYEGGELYVRVDHHGMQVLA